LPQLSFALRALITKGLGVFWILDGLLQLQPAMFGPAIITDVFAPNLDGQPAFIQAVIHGGLQLFQSNIVIANVLATVIQLAIGVLLLFPATGKAARTGLWLSIAWGLIVWIFGEGIGNLLTGSASFYTGAPGAVLIYVLAAALLLLPNMPADRLPRAAGLLLLFGAALQSQPVFWTPDGISSLFSGASSDSLSQIRVPATVLSALLASSPLVTNTLLMLLFAVPGIILLWRPSPPLAGITVLLLALIWLFPQDAGGFSTLPTGTTTDPNAAPVVALLLVPALLQHKAVSRWPFIVVKRHSPCASRRSHRQLVSA